MNTELDNVTIASYGVPSSQRTISLQEGASMAGRLVFKLVKYFLVTAPLLLMLLMVLALWGVIGKTTYTGLEAATRQDVALGTNEAKNYLVNEVKNSMHCPETSKSTDLRPQGEIMKPQKIDWEHAV